MRTLAEQWDEYRRDVLGPMPALLLEDRRQQFYAGAFAAIELLMLVPDDTSEAAHDVYLTQLLRDSIQYAAALNIEGRLSLPTSVARRVASITGRRVVLECLHGFTIGAAATLPEVGASVFCPRCWAASPP
jgi:hypothetical protein